MALTALLLLVVGLTDNLFSNDVYLFLLYPCVLFSPIALILCIVGLINEIKIYRRAESFVFAPIAITFYLIVLSTSFYFIVATVSQMSIN